MSDYWVPGVCSRQGLDRFRNKSLFREILTTTPETAMLYFTRATQELSSTWVSFQNKFEHQLIVCLIDFIVVRSKSFGLVTQFGFPVGVVSALKGFRSQSRKGCHYKSQGVGLPTVPKKC